LFSRRLGLLGSQSSPSNVPKLFQTDLPPSGMMSPFTSFS
jgi:hypothetical protein